MTDAILKIEHISQTYIDKGKVTEALKEINLDIQKGEFISIIGSSGCGKTTLLRMIAGLDKAQEGTLTLKGKQITGPDAQMGYVFQHGGLFPWQTIEQNIAAGLKARHVYKENRHRVQEYIDLIGLTGFEKVYPHQISGGMAQRVAIARALINNPSVLLLDEPMGALDSFTRADIQDKLMMLHKINDATMLLVTHDVDEAIYLSDRIVIMTPRPGRISEVMKIDMHHPRNRGSSEFMQIRKKILERFELASAVDEPEYTI